MAYSNTSRMILRFRWESERSMTGTQRKSKEVSRPRLSEAAGKDCSKKTALTTRPGGGGGGGIYKASQWVLWKENEGKGI